MRGGEKCLVEERREEKKRRIAGRGVAKGSNRKERETTAASR